MHIQVCGPLGHCGRLAQLYQAGLATSARPTATGWCRPPPAQKCIRSEESYMRGSPQPCAYTVQATRLLHGIYEVGLQFAHHHYHFPLVASGPANGPPRSV